MVAVDGFTVADAPDAWRSAGFDVTTDGACRVGGVTLDLVGRDAGRGLVGWSLSGMPDPTIGDLDGVPITAPRAAPGPDGEHPNGVTAIDHVVLLSPDLDRTVAALTSIGCEPRRERDGELGGRSIRQVFFRLGEVIVEVVGSPGVTNEGPATLWGMTYVVADIDATAAYFGENTSAVKDAVQPGRRITTLRHRAFDLSVRTALITPHLRSGS